MTKPYHLFISYASEDEAFARELSKSLKYLGLRVWFAPLSLNIGDKLLDSINAGLMTSEYGLIVLSPTYISKPWTSYELDVLHRQHIENNKKLFPLWHGVDKRQIDEWNPGLSGIVALRSIEGSIYISKKISDVIYQGCPVRGIAPSYENPQWRFLQGRGELFANNEDGGAFNLFEAAEFPDNDYPLYVHDKPHTREEIVLEVAKALYYGSHDEIYLATGQRGRMVKLCQEYGYDIEDPGFDPAFYG
jgi:hypothetical protein